MLYIFSIERIVFAVSEHIQMFVDLRSVSGASATAFARLTCIQHLHIYLRIIISAPGKLGGIITAKAR